MPPARLLAFDTSTESLAVAACGPAGWFTALAPGGAAASASLLPVALQVLARAGLQLQDVQAVAFGHGPGAFTGLRTACAVAQGLGLGLGVPVLPLDSLLVVAEDARLQLQGTEGPAVTDPWTVDVVMDARMNEVYAGRYRWSPPRVPDAMAATGRRASPWQVLKAPELLSLVELDRRSTEQPMAVVAGSALAVFADRWLLPPQVQRVPTEHNRAAALLRLALCAWADGDAVDPALALPLYGRDKVAQTTAEREQARAGVLAGAATTASAVAAVATAPAAAMALSATAPAPPSPLKPVARP